MASHDLATRLLDCREHRKQRAARRQNVVHEEDALARRDMEPAPELTSAGAVRAANFLREDPVRAELSGGLEGENDAPGRRACDQVDNRPAVLVSVTPGPERAKLARRRGVAEDKELLEIERRVAPALELEMACF